MPKVIENPTGRRMIKFSADDVITLVSIYQQYCGCKSNTYEEARQILKDGDYYLPEDV